MTDKTGTLTRFLKHSSIYSVGNMLNRVAVLLLLPLYTSHLSVGEYGALELFYVIAAIVSGFVSIGIAHATLRFYFDYEDEKDRRTVVMTNLLVSLLLSGTGAILVGWWSESVSGLVFGNTSYARGVQVVLLTLVLELSSQVCLAYLRAREKSLLFVGIMLVKLLIQCSANTYLVMYRGAGVEGVLFGNLLAVATGWLALVSYTIYECGWRVRISMVKPVLTYSFPFLLSTLTALVSSSVDRFLINGWLSVEALGIYALALKFSGLLDNIIGEPFARSYGAYRFAIMKETNAANIHTRVVRYLFLGTVAMGLGISMFAKDVLVIMAKAEYWPAAQYVPLLTIASVVQILNYPLQTGIFYAKKTRHIFQVSVITALTSAGGNLLLISLLGLAGACVAMIVTAIVTAFFTDRYSQRYFAVRYEYRGNVVAMILAVLVYGVSLVPGDLPLAVDVAGKSVLFLAFLVGLIQFHAVKPEEFQKVRISIGALLGKYRRAQVGHREEK